MINKKKEAYKQIFTQNYFLNLKCLLEMKRKWNIYRERF